MSKDLKVDTTLLRKLADELDAALAANKELKGSVKGDKDLTRKFIVEMAKAAGLASGIAQEATALIMDINHEVRAIQSPGMSGYEDFAELLGLKPPSSGSGGFGGGGSFN